MDTADWQRLEMPGADVRFLPSFLSEVEAATSFDAVREEMQWSRPTKLVYGKARLTPRLEAYHGDRGALYVYSRKELHPKPWTPALTELKERLEALCGVEFTAVLGFRYRDGQDSVSWHHDDEAQLGEILANVALGGTREVQFRARSAHKDRRKVVSTSGSLLVMAGTTQQNWEHQVPKRVRAEERINLSFRMVALR